MDRWTEASGIKEGCLFKAINKSGQIWGQGMTPKVLWEIVKRAAEAAGIGNLAHPTICGAMPYLELCRIAAKRYGLAVICAQA